MYSSLCFNDQVKQDAKPSPILSLQTSLVSVEGLSRLVDPSQLTSDLGGSLEYDHVEWTELRLGLEEFSGAATQLLAQLEQLEAGLNRVPEPQDVDEARK